MAATGTVSEGSPRGSRPPWPPFACASSDRTPVVGPKWSSCCSGPFFGVPLLLLPAQILWLNLLTHSFAGAGLAVQPADSRALLRGPRPLPKLRSPLA
ncbi:cation transporting ATPase C-terminal domain-containing protein [Terrabacter sp. MAHUQ-38]|uniref:cation transporting ATPase C-terminal domain-containing protein n=1 Tax=unclassified Terrabacter TaxID=2630222 RepID=UPI00351C6F0D